MRSLLLAAVLAFVLADPAPAHWQRPLPGAVARAFSYGPDPFASGWHRGVDLAGVPGATVRAACSGRVVTARPGLVTLRCGRWRVTHLPLATVTVRRGEAIHAGRAIGTLGGGSGSRAAAGATGATGAVGAVDATGAVRAVGAVGAAGATGVTGATGATGTTGATGAGHVGLHLGVRRAGERFGYVDPLPFLRTGTAPPPVAAARRIPRSGPPGAPRVPSARRVPPAGPRRVESPRAGPRRVATPRAGPRRVATPLAGPRRVATPLAGPQPAPRAPAAAPFADPARGPVPVGVRVFAPATVRGLAPWPAWIGLALLLLGAAGGGVRSGMRRRRARLPAPLPSAP